MDNNPYAPPQARLGPDPKPIPWGSIALLLCALFNSLTGGVHIAGGAYWIGVGYIGLGYIGTMEPGRRLMEWIRDEA